MTKSVHKRLTPKEVTAYALCLPESVEEHPFGPETDVYKIEGKIFAILFPYGTLPRLNLKCEPELALHLRNQYPAVTPGYHQNKRHWNTVALDGTMSRDEIFELIDHSYEQVIAGLPKSIRERLNGSTGIH